MTDYLVYDVFSDEAFGGNQLAIIPDAGSLPEADLQRIAREFNYSESTFVYPAENPSHTARVRIFTPTMEIPFAGHPIVGTVMALHDMGGASEMTLELGVGPLTCNVKNGQVSFTTSAELEIMAEPDVSLVAEALGLEAADISCATHTPTMASLGLPFTITELTSREALARCVPETNVMRRGAETYPSSLDFAQFAYVKEGNTIHARMFAPLDNIPEDPATGSACAALGALLAKFTGSEQTLNIRQGEDMGRLSLIGLSTDHGAVTISGTAKRTMQGQLVY